MKIRLKFPKLPIKRWKFPLRHSTPTPINYEDDPYTFDEGEIIRVYTIYSKQSENNEQTSPPGKHKTATKGYKSSTKALAPLYPILIPAWLAWENLGKAICEINQAKAYKILHLAGLENQSKMFLVKRGLWGGAGARVFFAVGPDGTLKRHTVVKTENGYPGICKNDVGFPCEIRIVKVSDAMPSVCEPELEQPKKHMPLETISSHGPLPLWVQNILETAREHKQFMDEQQASGQSSLLEIADISHTAACTILSLDDSKKPLLRKDVQTAYKIRMNIVHPDKIIAPDIDTLEVVHALVWAKQFLTPL